MSADPAPSRRGGLHGSGPLVELSASERRERHAQVLAEPPRRYSLQARAIFWLEDRVWGTERTLSKCKAQELVARAPYQAWAVRHPEPQADENEADNERCHREVLSTLIAEDGVREDPIRFGLAPSLALLAMYGFARIQHRVDPRGSHRLNVDIEDHATREYARLVTEHPEWDQLPYRPAVAEYGTYESRADVLRQICCDEQEHRTRSLALANRVDGCGE